MNNTILLGLLSLSMSCYAVFDRHAIIDIDNQTDRPVVLQTRETVAGVERTSTNTINSHTHDMVYIHAATNQMKLVGINSGNREAKADNFSFPYDVKLSQRDLMPMSQSFVVTKDRRGIVKAKKLSD